jgi:hypothetical protein
MKAEWSVITAISVARWKDANASEARSVQRVAPRRTWARSLQEAESGAFQHERHTLTIICQQSLAHLRIPLTRTSCYGGGAA